MHVSKLTLPIIVTCLLAITTQAGAVTTNFSTKEEAGSLNQKLYRLAQREKVASARYYRVRGREFLAFTESSQRRLLAYDQWQSIEGAREYLMSIIADAGETALKASHTEWKRIRPKEKLQLASSWTDYEKSVRAQINEEVQLIQTLDNLHQLKQYKDILQEQINPAYKPTGETGRQLLSLAASPFIHAWIGYHAMTDNRVDHAVNFDQAIYYEHNLTKSLTKKPLELKSEELLKYFAPLIVAEQNPNAEYSPTLDRIGEVSLKGSDLESALPIVKIDSPTLYSYTQVNMIAGIEVTQLVYVLWFPEHPAIKSENDPEAGILDGWTLRITLNQSNEPVIYESISNCGCYYKIYPIKMLEEMARLEYPDLIHDKHLHIENQVSSKIDATVPDTLDIESGRVTLFFEAGTHQMVTMKPIEELEAYSIKATNMIYRLAAYKELEQIPFSGREASLFEPSGLVRNAHRAECVLLAPSGVYHAGHPRQRTTQYIYFDQFGFDDPQLFETYLRLPTKAFEKSYD